MTARRAAVLLAALLLLGMLWPRPRRVTAIRTYETASAVRGNLPLVACNAARPWCKPTFVARTACESTKPVCSGPIAPPNSRTAVPNSRRTPRDLFYWDAGAGACKPLRTSRSCTGLVYSTEAACKAATASCTKKPARVPTSAAFCTTPPVNACSGRASRPGDTRWTSYVYSPASRTCEVKTQSQQCQKTVGDFDTKAECDAAAAKWCTPKSGA